MHRIDRRPIVRYLVMSVIAVAMVFPFVWMVSNSFSSRASIFQIPPVLVPAMLFEPGMFANYFRLFAQYDFGRMRFPGRRILFVLILAAMMIPIHAPLVPEYFLMDRLGWLNSYARLIVPSLLIGTFG